MKQEPNNTVVGAALAIGVKPQVLQDALYVLRADIPISELIWDNSRLLAENERLRKELSELKEGAAK